MISIENVPRTGILIVSVYFEGYEGSYQNDSRRRLMELVNQIVKDEGLNVSVTPFSFSLIKTVVGGKTRATGAQYQYGYSNMNGSDLKTIFSKLKERKKSFWKDVQIMIATDIEGLE
jgi:hypothetical protein